jgi:hypothetical protein
VCRISFLFGENTVIEINIFFKICPVSLLVKIHSLVAGTVVFLAKRVAN